VITGHFNLSALGAVIESFTVRQQALEKRFPEGIGKRFELASSLQLKVRVRALLVRLPSLFRCTSALPVSDVFYVVVHDRCSVMLEVIVAVPSLSSLTAAADRFSSSYIFQ